MLIQSTKNLRFHFYLTKSHGVAISPKAFRDASLSVTALAERDMLLDALEKRFWQTMHRRECSKNSVSLTGFGEILFTNYDLI